MALFSVRRSGRGLSTGGQQRGGAGCLILFGLVFAGFGSLFVALFFVLPLTRALAAQHWVEVPCTILESRVGESRSSDGTTYRVEVRYEYRYRVGDLEADADAPRYEATRYDFFDGMYSSGQEAKAAEVRRLAPGSRHTCRVDPDDPAQAVLVAGIPDGLWFTSFTLLFPLVGLGLVVGGIVSARRARRQREGREALTGGAAAPVGSTATSATPADGVGPVELRPAQGRLGKLIAIGLVALVWNGITWTILLVAIIPDLRGGDWFSWLPLLFLSLFALIGLGLIAATCHQLLALGNPRLRLTVNRRALHPGQELTLEWECSGDPARIRALTISLEGRESATYTRGTDTTTETTVFARTTLAHLEDTAAMLSGRARLVLPTDVVPTFTAAHNKLEWYLTVRGVIPRWPDISDDYAISILPPGGPS
jgi:hypothetical protein